MEINFRPIGVAREIVNESGLEITYAYDDLLFIENSILIIKFNDENSSIMGIYFSTECDKDTGKDLFYKLKDAATQREMNLESLGRFSLREDAENENVKIEFIEERGVFINS